VVIEFLTDPLGWIKDQYTWFLDEPGWYLALCILFWPAVFARAWAMDEWDRRTRRRRRRKELAQQS
jgi:hypothetical protein